MFLEIGIGLIILWLIGIIAMPVLGWFVHILLILAIISILIRIIKGK